MKKIKFISYAVFVILLGFAISSCKGDDGPAGADGIDGVDGVDGAEGNANVATIELMATDVTWTLGSFIGVASNVYTFNTTTVDQDILDHGAVLGFAHLDITGFDFWGPLPFDYDSGGGTLYIAYTYALNNISLYAYGYIGAWDPNLSFPEYRFLVITDNTIGKSMSTESVLEELKNAGIDVNNYFEVCDYYGINP